MTFKWSEGKVKSDFIVKAVVDTPFDPCCSVVLSVILAPMSLTYFRK